MASPAPTLEALLRRRGAWFEGSGIDLGIAEHRAAVTRAIAESFPAFETLRDSLAGERRGPVTAAHGKLGSLLATAGLIDLDSDGIARPVSSEARRYVTGGWLEEFAGLALKAAEADEVRIGQEVRWIAKGFEGANEIDALARFGERIVFVSAKALRSRLSVDDARHRERLMSALQEADNLADHFGDARSIVALLVTTDLFDEAARLPRYEQLHGKAAALRVELVSLEGMSWASLVARFRRLAERKTEVDQ